MLTRLEVRAFAVLDELELELAAGFTALTGETGAGKSLLVDALALALGERADSAIVRQGAPRAEVTAFFDVTGDRPARDWLSAHDLDDGNDCQLRRVITPEGRSRGYINGRAAPIELLREAGALLVEICGQHAHQALERKSAQRELLDEFAGHGKLLADVAGRHAAWSAARTEAAVLERNRRDRDGRLDLLSYQHRELASLAVAEGEFESLSQERGVLANVDRIATGLGTALEALYDADEASAHATLSSAGRVVDELATLDAELVDAAAELHEAAIHLREASDRIRRRLSSLEQDPARLRAVDSRLASIEDLGRKHRRDPAELWRLADEMAVEMAGLAGSDQRLAELQEEAARQQEQLGRAIAALRASRTEAAARLASAVNGNLHRLGMPLAEFRVEVAPMALEDATAGGGDEVAFLVRTNPDQASGPIGRIASGGELSRLNLAIRLASLGHGSPATLIFDEVDAGTGGGVAEIVGKSLRQLAGRRQVLCITHLPQVASQAQQHCRVEKSTSGGVTRTAVRPLDRDERVEEIARMLGGVRITERARDHAREMLGDKARRRTG